MNINDLKNTYIISSNIKRLFFIIILIIINIISFINKKINKQKICLCVIGKNENAYAKEFVNHYKKLGYNHIYIYDNDIDKERFSDILYEDIKDGFVSIIDYRGYKTGYYIYLNIMHF